MKGDPYESPAKKDTERQTDKKMVDRLTKFGLTVFCSVGIYGILSGIVLATYYIVTGDSEIMKRAAASLGLLAVGFFSSLIICGIRYG